MGRGLGELQVAILRVLHNRRMLQVQDLLQDLWGWQQAKPWKETGQIFSRGSIGAEEYSRVHSSLSRSLERLRLRSLTETFKNVAGTGTIIALTAFGRQVAQEIAEAEGEEEEAGPE